MIYFEAFAGSGIGSKAIHDVFDDALCAGYSEIDPYAVQIIEKNFPNHLNFGDLTELDPNIIPDIDLVIGGSPCQDFSIMRKERKGLNGEKSSLFFRFWEILRVKRPKYFILENVASMGKEDQSAITHFLENIYGKDCVYMTKINSDLVSAQSRVRLYWTNFPVSQPEDKGILYPGIVAYSKSGRRPEDRADGLPLPHWKWKIVNGKKKYFQERWRRNGKANTLTTGLHCNSNLSRNFVEDYDGEMRLLNPDECDQLQVWPSGWTEGIPEPQRYKVTGNGFNYSTIYHILKELQLSKGDS